MGEGYTIESSVDIFYDDLYSDEWNEGGGIDKVSYEQSLFGKDRCRASGTERF